MINDKDIERAVNLFKRWDLEATWKKPDEVFITPLKEKADDCLDVEKVLIELMEKRELVETLINKKSFNPPLWIINSSYYSIFFNAQSILAHHGKKLPDNTQDTHKTIFLAMLYYFIVKGSGLEGRSNLKWDDIRESKLSKALLMFMEAPEESEELFQQRAKSTFDNFSAELEERRKFTYKIDFHARENVAFTSYKRAIDFRTIVS
jgi:hypothetical protein